MYMSAVLVGLGLNGLGVARSLGKEGVRVIALDSNPRSPTWATRYADVRHVESLAGVKLINTLLELRSALPSDPVLLLTEEEAVATVSAMRERLAGKYLFSLPSDDLIRRLLDKLTFQELAEQLGSPIPRSLRISHDTDHAELASLRYPCVLKAATKTVEFGRRFRKAYRVSNPAEAINLWQQMRDLAPEMILQEWIEGSDADVYFCLQYRPSNRRDVISFTGRKLMQWPPLVGGTATCIPAPEVEQELSLLTEQFFSSVGFVGLCSMEYKRDSRNGRFYMVEPTVGRTDYQEEVATLNGVNIPFAAWRAEMGLPSPPRRQTRLLGWRDPFGEANSRAAAPTEARQSTMPMQNAYWSPTDPFPFFAVHSQRVRNRLTRLLRGQA
jgi:predicted ATP-grasp superfamily ATP-dependent carboligase